MKIERIQGGSCDGIDTHETVYFRHIWRDLPGLFSHGNGLFEEQLKVADPFARDCTLAHPFTNDIDPSTNAKVHLCAREFLSNLQSNYFELVIFDPPFSRSQEEKYEGSKNVYATPGFIPKCMREIHRILRPAGYMLKFGYNSTRHHPSFECKKIWLVNIGGNRNDVVVSLWQKTNTTLEDWD